MVPKDLDMTRGLHIFNRNKCELLKIFIIGMAYHCRYSQNGLFMLKPSPMSAKAKPGWTLCIFDGGCYKAILKLTGSFEKNSQWACISSKGDRFVWFTPERIFLAELGTEWVTAAYQETRSRHVAGIPSVDITQKVIQTAEMPSEIPNTDFVCSFNCDENLVLAVAIQKSFVWDLAKNTTWAHFLYLEQPDMMCGVTLHPNPTQLSAFMIKVPNSPHQTIINVSVEQEFFRVMSIYLGTTGEWTYDGGAFFYLNGCNIYTMVTDSSFPCHSPSKFLSHLESQNIVAQGLMVHVEACHPVSSEVALVQFLTFRHKAGPYTKNAVYYNLVTGNMTVCKEFLGTRCYPFIIKHPGIFLETHPIQDCKQKRTDVAREFPVDALWHVFARLDIKSLLTVGHTCSTWRRVATDDSLWLEFATSRDPCNKMVHLLKAVHFRAVPWYKFFFHRLLSFMKDSITLTDRELFLTCSVKLPE